MLTSAYLTPKQLSIWDMYRRGQTQTEIGKLTDASRQAIYDMLKVSLEKVENALMHVAAANMIQPLKVDPRNGILLGFLPSNNQRVIITFSMKNGVQTWHYEEPNCSICNWINLCTQKLLNEAEERDITLSNEEMKFPPSKLAHVIFSKLLPELST